jgi:hypothetical protein
MLRNQLKYLWPPDVPKPLGLFRKVCASVILGEIIQDIDALRKGEKYPLIFFLDDSNKILLSADFHRLYSQIV